MTPLVWVNFPLMALFALAIAGIPLWMVFRHPDRAPDHSEAHAYLQARAEQLRRIEPGAAAPTQVTATTQPAQGRAGAAGSWPPPRGGMPGSRHPATGPAGRAKDRDPATRRGRRGT